MTINFADMTNTELTEFLHTTHAEVNAKKALLLVGVAAFEHRNLASNYGAASTVAWLQRELDISQSTAYEYLRYGLRLVRFQHLMHAAVNGQLTYSTLRVLLNYAVEGDETWELRLLEMAGEMRFDELRAALAGLKSTENTSTKPDTVRVWVDEDTGRVRLYGDLTPATGAKFLAALKIGELANLVDLADIDPEVFDDDHAVTELLGKAEEQDVPVEAEPEQDECQDEAQPPAQRTTASRFGPPMRNAVLSSFLGLINIARCRPTNKLRTPSAQVSLFVTEDGHVSSPTQPGARSDSLVQEALNAEVLTHFLSKEGLTLQVGRRSRFATDGQVASLMAAWNHRCAGPGCAHTRFLEFHHIHAYAEGGHTDEWNLVPLCGECHSLVSDGLIRLEVAGKANELLRFTYPDGNSILVRNRHATVRFHEHNYAAA